MCPTPTSCSKVKVVFTDRAKKQTVHVPRCDSSTDHFYGRLADTDIERSFQLLWSEAYSEPCFSTEIVNG